MPTPICDRETFAFFLTDFFNSFSELVQTYVWCDLCVVLYDIKTIIIVICK